MNVNCNGNKNICEAIITITFLFKQTIMKHDINKFNLIHFEWIIQNLINLRANVYMHQANSVPKIRSLSYFHIF